MSRYKDWMMKTIEIDRPPYHLYESVIWILYSQEFYWSFPLDENEIGHAQDMRCNYGFKELRNLPVTVLEVMISLAIRAEIKIMQGRIHDNRTALWFWSMFHNLGLDKFRDSVVNEENDFPGRYEEIEEIICNFLDRAYDHDGNGGMFPVKDCRWDMRQKSLYLQMNIWLSANYS